MSMLGQDFTWAEVGARIRDRRRRRGMSQQALADAAGFTQNGIFLLEAGRTNPQLVTLQRIASALGCSVRDLVVGSTDLDPSMAERVLQVRRILDSSDPAAIQIMNSGIDAAEALLERVVRKLVEPPLKRIVKGEGRRSPVDELLLMKGQPQQRLDSDDSPVGRPVRKAGKPFRNSGTTNITRSKYENK